MIFQFAVSIILIIGTLLIHTQLQFIRKKGLGFEKENLLILPLTTETLRAKNAILKSELLNIPAIMNITASSDFPSQGFESNGYLPQGFHSWIFLHVVDADEDFLKTYRIPLISGKYFSEDLATDNNAFLINETGAQLIGWDNPIGKYIHRNGDHAIIGVVKDFHFSSMHQKIAPLVITNRPEYGNFRYLSLRLTAGNLPDIISQIKHRWHKIVPAEPFEYFFFDEALDQLYKTEAHFRRLFFDSSLISIIIAVMGLFSLVSLSTEYRKKEIGIRKALGASVLNITRLVSKEFVIAVLAANAIAWPVAFYIGNKWLEYFAYRINMHWWIFVLSGTLALLIALLAVSWQAIRAATANPVEALRYE